MYPMSGERDAIGTMAILLNLLPAMLAGTVPPGVVEPAFGGMGWQKATWVRTAAFAALSVLQWTAIGLAITCFRERRRSRKV
jgi:hypothetical protein